MAHILIIEDEAPLRRMLAALLAHAGYEVTEATDGIDGVQKSAAHPPDLVLTDLLMPRQEGIETIRRLRGTRTDLPIIAMSGGGVNSGVYLQIARKLGARATLLKPFSNAELLAAVSAAIPAPQPVAAAASPA